jgi:hypothetical protein
MELEWEGRVLTTCQQDTAFLRNQAES